MKFLVRVIKLFAGTFCFAFGLVLIMKSNLGYGPWELFHTGLINIFKGITLGQMTTITSILIVLLDWILKEKIGFGTVINMFMMGTFMDIILKLDFIPEGVNLIGKIVLIILGFFVVAVGSWIYISSGFGAGPRDGLMVALRRKTGIAVGVSRAIIETVAGVIGWILGGPAGIGTLCAIVGQGFFVQIVFKAVKFEPTAIKHETFKDTIVNLTSKKNKTA